MCAAIGIVSPQLRALREKVAASLGDGAKVYYDAHGHVSLVYVQAKQRAELEKLLKSIGSNAVRQTPYFVYCPISHQYRLMVDMPTVCSCVLG